MHDARMLSASPFFENWEEKAENCRLLGDSAYMSNNLPSCTVTATRNDGRLTKDDMSQNTALCFDRVNAENVQYLEG